jgi:hypothetical protein
MRSRRVFQGLNYSAARQAMSRAYRPRRSRTSPRTTSGTGGSHALAPGRRPARELAKRAGHSKPSMRLHVSTHVMPVAEVAKERFATILV